MAFGLKMHEENLAPDRLLANAEPRSFRLDRAAESPSP